MKKHYLILFFSMIFLGALNAQVIVSEDFDYSVGGALAGANGGVGWASGWVLDGPEQNVTEDSIKNYRTGKASGTLLKFSKNTGDASENIRYLRQFSTPLTDDGNDYWLGFSMRIDSTGGNVTNFILTESTTPAGASLDLVIGKIFNGNLALGPNGAFQQTGSVNLLRENWFVAKISYSGGAGDDVVRLFVNPDPDVTPDDADAVLTYTGTGLDGKTLNSVLIRAEANPPNVVAYDDIYIGNGYSDVIPTTADDIAKYLPVHEKFDYSTGNIVGNGTATDGWGGAWSLTGGVDQVIVDDSVANDIIARSTRGNALLMDNAAGETRLTRPLSQTYEDNGLTYWFGYFGDFENADGNDTMLGMLINSATETMGSGGPNGQFAAAGKWDGSYQFGVGKFSGGFDKEVTTLTEDGAHWVVMSVETTGDAVADTLRLFLDPDPSVEPQNGEEVVKFWSTRLNNGWQAIGIKNAPGSLRTIVDDMYLAIDYEDIVPDDLVVIEGLPTPAFEKFEYTAASGLSGNGTASDGWAGPWELIDMPEHNVVAESIVNSNILKITTGNSLLMDATVGESRYARELETPYNDNGNTYWMSFFGNFTDAGGNDILNVMLINNETETMGAGGPDGQFLGVGKWDAAFQFGLGKFSGGFNKSGDNINLTSDDAHWFVVSIETTGNSDADTVRLYLNPDPSVTPVIGEEDVKYVTTTLNGGWRGIGIKNGAGTLKANIDDIYLGNSFTDVVPGDLLDVSIPTAASESFDYPAGTLGGQGAATDGWAGPWQILTGTDPSIVVDSITNVDVFRQTLPNGLQVNASDGAMRMFRPLEDRYEDNGLTYWLSFFAEFGTTTGNDVSVVMLVNNDTETLGASGGNGQFAAIGKWTSAGSIGVGSFGPFEESVATNVAEGTHWLVARIETNGTADRDTIRLYLNPDPNIEPQVGDEILKFAASELNGGWDAIGYKNDAGNTTTLIDDIYLGSSYAEVVPGDLVDIEFLYTAGSTYEGFDYTADANLASNGTRSDGWGGPWVQTAGDDIVIESGSIETEFAITEGNKALVNYTTDAIQYDREFSGRFSDDGSSVWMSFLIDFGTATSINTEAKVILMDGTEEKVGFGRTAGFNRIGLIWDPEVFEFISNTDSDGEHWVVVRIDFSGDDNPEDFYMWINPNPEIQPDVNRADLVVDATSENRRALNSGFDGIRISASGGPSITYTLDELRLGFSFSDVTTVEEEIPENLIARDQFRYPEGESLLGLGSSGDQWDGPWSFGAGGGGPASVDAGNLSVSGVSGKDNSATVFGGTGTGPGRFARILANPIPDDGNQYWFSFIGKANQNVGQGGFGDASGDNTVLFGKRNPDAEVSILDIGGSSEFVKTTTTAGQNNWYVARVSFSGDAEPDVVTLWMNPDPEAGPDLDFPDAELSVTSLNNGIASVFFRAEGGVTEISMDEIHFGTTFESVVPVGDAGDGPLGLSEVSNLVNYPNPFRETTTFQFSLENREVISLSILDLNGKEIVKLLDGLQSKGEHRITWDGTGKDGSRLSQGMYLYKFSMGDKLKVGRILLLDN